MATWGLSPWAVNGVGICQGSERTEELGEPTPPWWASGTAGLHPRPRHGLAWKRLWAGPMSKARGPEGLSNTKAESGSPDLPLHPRPELCVWRLFQKQHPVLFSVRAPILFVPRWVCSASPSPTRAGGPVLVRPSLKEVSGSTSAPFILKPGKKQIRKAFPKIASRERNCLRPCAFAWPPSPGWGYRPPPGTAEWA